MEYHANQISRKILLHVGRGIFRVKSFTADNVIVNDASKRIRSTASRHRVRKIARVRHKAFYSLPAKFVSGPLCRVRRCVCTHQVHSSCHDTCFDSHIKHSEGRNFSERIVTWYCFILLLGDTLDFVRFRLPILMLLLRFCRSRIGFSYFLNRNQCIIH